MSFEIDASIPSEAKGLSGWVMRHFQRVRTEWNAERPSVVLKTLDAEPVQKRPNMLVMADGTNWTVGGQGRGVYRWDAVTLGWVKLG